MGTRFCNIAYLIFSKCILKLKHETSENLLQFQLENYCPFKMVYENCVWPSVICGALSPDSISPALTHNQRKKHAAFIYMHMARFATALTVHEQKKIRNEFPLFYLAVLYNLCIICNYIDLHFWQLYYTAVWSL